MERSMPQQPRRPRGPVRGDDRTGRTRRWARGVALAAACLTAPIGARAQLASAELPPSEAASGAAPSLAAAVRAAPAGPVHASSDRAALLHVQALLDAARFAPGMLDGAWSENTLFAIRAFRQSAGLPAGDDVDAATYARLRAAAGAEALVPYTLTAADVRGPFRRLPAGIYARARVDCLCYQSLVEALSERFHVRPEVLRALNPDVDLAHAGAGTTLTVPAVARTAPAPAALASRVARLVVNRGEGSLRGEDARGALLFWLPVTVGAPEEPSPVGRLRVVSVTPSPHYHYNPRVLGDVPDSRPDAHLPPGPNSPVGVLWVQLSKAHVGLHGTPDPETVGRAMSHGCVRLANWDAQWLTGIVRPGLVVDFE